MRAQPVKLELEGGRARLEPLSLAHAPDLTIAAQDDAIWRYLPEPRPMDVAAVEAFIGRALDQATKVGDVPFAIIDRRAGRAVGSTRYLDIQPENLALEIGWTWLGVSAQRSSVNTECKFLLLRHAFEALGCIRVQLKSDARNERSRRAMERIGATFEGILRRHRIMHDGHQRDSSYYSVLDNEWPGVKQRLDAMLRADRTSWDR
jgi:RimJ/RimL family protein N-acetyltransferase